MRDGQRWCCLCAYDGTDFAGWQSQVQRNTLQDVLERRLREIFQRDVPVAGSGRTDAGVHATGQIFHFDSPPWRHGTESLLRALGCGLPRSIRLRALTPAPEDFHARFSAVGKRYTYHLAPGLSDPFHCRFCHFLGPGTCDGEVLQRAAPLFLGTHDFSSFANRRGDGDPHRTLTSSELLCDGLGWIYRVEGSGFLYRMVRRLVGALLAVACGRATERDIWDRLRHPGQLPPLPSSPPQGLFLERVFYAKDSPIERWLREREGD
jgi:tRNA pseudouridine38-40 synthase